MPAVGLEIKSAIGQRVPHVVQQQIGVGPDGLSIQGLAAETGEGAFGGLVRRPMTDRAQGLGKQLLRYAMEHLNANELDVNEQNPQALGFYFKQGFEVIGRSEVDGMGQPYPLLHMRLRQAQQKTRNG